LFVLVVLLLLVSVGFQFYFGWDLKTSHAPRSIISLELAGSARRAESILDYWTREQRASAVCGLWFDFGFLISYALVFTYACRWAGQRLSTWTGGPNRRATATFVALAWAAAGFDAIEDVCLLWQLQYGASDFLALAARMSAVLKFSLVLVCLLYVINGLLVEWPPRGRLTTPGRRLLDVWCFVVPAIGASVLVNSGVGVVVGLFFLMLRYYGRYGLASSLFRYLADRPIQATILVLFYLLVYGLLGKDLGVTNLIWADRAEYRWRRPLARPSCSASSASTPTTSFPRRGSAPSCAGSRHSISSAPGTMRAGATRRSGSSPAGVTRSRSAGCCGWRDCRSSCSSRCRSWSRMPSLT
jgi:hypothetical protein